MPLTKIENDALSNTVTANIASLAIGANVSINSSAIFVGNSTVNTVMTATTLTAGANVSINSSAIFVGNSTVNTVMTASGLVIANNFGVSSNTTNFLENRGGQLFFNGRRVKNINPYAPAVAVYGYALGGTTGAVPGVTTADRLTFSTSATAASTISNLSQARYYPCGVSDISVYGYALGGYSNAAVATTDRTTFSTSATAAYTAANISSARYAMCPVSDGAVYGYVLGASGGPLTTADRITFSTSTTAASTISNLTQARYVGAGVSDAAVYGYALGGNSGVITTTADRLAFSTSVTAASTVSNLSQARSVGCGISDGAVYGYVLGGSGASNASTTADRLTFSTSITAASTVSNLPAVRSDQTCGSVSDGAVYGYSLGGSSGAYVSASDRLTFSTSVVAASTVSNLSTARGDGAGFSDGAV